MTLQELYYHVAPYFSPSSQKDLKTAIKTLTLALGYGTPESCPSSAYRLPLTQLYQLLEKYLRSQQKGFHTIRNIKNNTSRMFRLAEQHQLFTLPAPIPTPRFDPYHRPPRPGALVSRPDHSFLPYRHWPSSLQEAFTAFAHWATAPVVPHRPAALRKRQYTLDGYKTTFEAYFGYLTHIRHITDVRFDHLFIYDLLSDFVTWHINEKMGYTSVSIINHLKCFIALTNQYRPMPELRSQLTALRRTLPNPKPVYDKTDAWVSLEDLYRIGLSIWPKITLKEIEQRRKKNGSVSKNNKKPVVFEAMDAGFSLMLRLWTYIPYRQRNMREMRLTENLYKNPQGQWRIKFIGEQLKVSQRKGKTNILDLPFPNKLVPHLEIYLNTWRPILIANCPEPPLHVFLNRYGKPHTRKALTRSTGQIVYRYTGKYWHPHIIRTVWTTEWIRNTHGDFYTAAVMLNDTLETVIHNYAHLLEEDVAEKAYRLVEERNSTITPDTKEYNDSNFEGLSNPS